MQTPPAPQSPSATEQFGNRSGSGPWRIALMATAVILIGLAWILALLLWLPAFFGLFFFFIAGMLSAGLTFRLAAPARPIARARLLRGIALLAAVSTLATVFWEHHHIAATVADPPAFAKAKNAALEAQGSEQSVVQQAVAEFRRKLAEEHPPGGAIGYARWALDSGRMELKVGEHSEPISISHRRGIWAARTLVAFLLTAAGLWLSFDALRSAERVSNVLRPGEEYEEID